MKNALEIADGDLIVLPRGIFGNLRDDGGTGRI